MCMYEEHRCISILNMKFLRLTLWLGQLLADDDANDNDANDDA